MQEHHILDLGNFECQKQRQWEQLNYPHLTRRSAAMNLTQNIVSEKLEEKHLNARLGEPFVYA